MVSLRDRPRDRIAPARGSTSFGEGRAPRRQRLDPGRVRGRGEGASTGAPRSPSATTTASASAIYGDKACLDWRAGESATTAASRTSTGRPTRLSRGRDDAPPAAQRLSPHPGGPPRGLLRSVSPTSMRRYLAALAARRRTGQPLTPDDSISPASTTASAASGSSRSASRARRRSGGSNSAATATPPGSGTVDAGHPSRSREHSMGRPVTLFTGQWADLPFEEICKKASELGLRRPRDRLLGRPHGRQAAASTRPTSSREAQDPQEAQPPVLGARRAPGRPVRRRPCTTSGCSPSRPPSPGQAGRAPAWAVEEMTAHRAGGQGHGVRRRRPASWARPIWHAWYSFPPTTEEMIEAGFQEIRQLWTPHLRRVRPSARQVRRSRSIRPRSPSTSTPPSGCCARSTHRPTLGFNFDPSHLVWQGIEPHLLHPRVRRPDLPRPHEGRGA